MPKYERLEERLDMYYANVLHKGGEKGPKNFLDELSANILQGEQRARETEAQLRVLEKEDRTGMLEDFEDGRGDTLLHKMALFHKDISLMESLVRLCPALINKPRAGEFQGQTALHIVISKDNVDAASFLLSHASELRRSGGGTLLEELFQACATGERFRDTVMMGQLPLSVAALTLNLDMVTLLLDYGAQLHAQNALGDTVLHSLVRYAGVHSDQRASVLEMLRSLHDTLAPRNFSRDMSRLSRRAGEDKKRDPLEVWLLENDAGQTPLKLAAVLGEADIFAAIFALDGVYSQLDEHDGVFDIHLCDITEIDTVAQHKWGRLVAHPTTAHTRPRKPEKKKLKNGQVAPVGGPGDLTPATPSSVEVMDGKEETPSPDAEPSVGCCASQAREGTTPHRREAVLEIICTISVRQAFGLLRVDVVRDTIKAKWAAYRPFFYLWMFLHLCLMTLLTTYAVYKTKVINVEVYDNDNNIITTTTNSSVSTTAGPTSVTQQLTPALVSAQEENLVQATAWLSICFGGVYLALEAVRSFYMRQAWHFRLIHHNGLYRLTLVLFSLSLIADSCWFLSAPPDNNYFLILALLLGWWFMTFALRVHKKFSFFTVMFQKVLLGDMFRFSLLIMLELLSFSVAMHVTYLNSLPIPDGFRNLGVTVMTMFKLMLGLTDIEILYDARHPWMAVTLFVLFVLFTYVLLINSLIAMMSQTCALVSEDRNSQWELQTLSVVLLLESLLPSCCRHCPGEPKKVLRYDIKKKKKVEDQRYFRSVTSIQTQYSDGHAIVKRIQMISTLGFDDHSMQHASPMENFGLLATQMGTTGPFTSQMAPYKRTASPIRQTNTLARLRYQRLHSLLKINNLLKQNNPLPFKSTNLQKPNNPESPNTHILTTIKDEREEERNVEKNTSRENGSVTKSPSQTRRRHNSELRSKKIQTDSAPPEPLSKSLPDGDMRKQLEEARSAQPVVHFLTIPDITAGPTNTNSQPVQGLNGQPLHLQNGKLVHLQNGQPAHLQNGQPVHLQNDHQWQIQNGQLVQNQNGQQMLIQNIQPVQNAPSIGNLPLQLQNGLPYISSQPGYVLTNTQAMGGSDPTVNSAPPSPVLGHFVHGPVYGQPVTFRPQSIHSAPPTDRSPLGTTTPNITDRYLLVPPKFGPSARVRTISDGILYDPGRGDNLEQRRDHSHTRVHFRDLDINDVKADT
ncbi:uncharacterized protein LOC101846237 [Aplysia californica]|uniref:Uncharacterized protein LOC101846237 n=1 Tax=Aplysia californica TaxID=6500 RepID=A0ABM0K0A1_APLCA|nr:uncharacterized protein LOC101846237 [Aplysia californica]